MSGTQGDKSSSSSGPERSHLPFGFGDYVGGLGGQQQQQHHHDHHRLDVTNGANRRAAISSHPPTFPAGMLATTGRGFEHARTSAEPSLSVGAHYLNAASSSSATATTGLTTTTMTSRNSTTIHPAEGYRRAGINLTSSGLTPTTAMGGDGDGRPLGLFSGNSTVTGEGGQQFMLVPVYISHPPPQSNSFSLAPPPPPTTITTSAATVQAHYRAAAAKVDTSTHGPIAELLALRHSSDHRHSIPMKGPTYQEYPPPPTDSASAFYDSSALQFQQHQHPHPQDQHGYGQEDPSSQTRFVHRDDQHPPQSTITTTTTDIDHGVFAAPKGTKNHNPEDAVALPVPFNKNYHHSAVPRRTTTRPRTRSSSCSSSSSDSDHQHPSLPVHPSAATKVFHPEKDSTSASGIASPDNDKTSIGIATKSLKRPLLRTSAISSTSEVRQNPDHDHDHIENAHYNSSSKKKRIDSSAAPTSPTKATKGSSGGANTFTAENKELVTPTTAAATATTSQHQSNSNKQSNSSRFIWSSDLNDQFCSSVFQVGLKLASATSAHSKLLANAAAEGRVKEKKGEEHSTTKDDNSSSKSKEESTIESGINRDQQPSSQKQTPSLEEVSHYLEDYRKHQVELMTLFSQTKFDADHLPYRLGEFSAHLTFQSMKKANEERQKSDTNSGGEASTSDSNTRASSPRSTVELQPPATEAATTTSPFEATNGDGTNVTAPEPSTSSAPHKQTKNIQVVSDDGQIKDAMKVDYDELPLPSLTPEEVASPIGKAMIHLVGLIHSINYQVVDGRIQAIKQRQQQQQQRDEGEENNERKNQTASSSFAHVQEATTRALCKKMEPSR